MRNIMIGFLSFFLLSACNPPAGKQVWGMIPKPDSVCYHPGSLSIETLKTLQMPDGWKDTGAAFLDDMRKRTGLILSFSAEAGHCQVKMDNDLPEEAYVLRIQKEGIRIETGGKAGAYHALVTLQQLVLQSGDGKLPYVTISDSPRFPYRGMMLDCSRHFWSIDELKESIDQLSFFKLNVLHLHLTDNQGWRLALDDFPDLVKKGSYYKDYPELSGKYYTKEELKDLVAYAAARGVEIIPEVDLPGHSLALLAGMPELSCRGGLFETYPEEMPSEQRKRTNETMVCVGNPQVYTFVADLVDALAEIFPSPFIHLGGDEVSTAIWETCPKCQALYQKEGMTDYHQLQDYFTRQVRELVHAKGKTMMGWDEINARGAASPEDMLTIWRNDGIEQQEKALERNIPVVMCPKDPCYFDFGYARNPTRKVYEWEPVEEGLPEEKQALVKGGQGCLWTEFVTSQAEVERMFYPRLCALAEVLWSKPEKRNWTDFFHRLQAGSWLDKLGIDYYPGDSLEEQWFRPKGDSVKLVHAAQVKTDMAAAWGGYEAVCAFDGSLETFFSTSYAPQKGNYLVVILDEPLRIQSVKVICDDSKEYLSQADLLISTDGETFQKVAQFSPVGKASASWDGEPVKAVKIEVTGNHFNRLTIREIVLD